MGASLRHPVAVALLACAVNLGLAPPAAAQPPIRAAAGSELLELLQNQLDRTDDVLERVGSMVTESNRPKAQSLFDDAVRLQKLAREMFDQLSASIDNLGLAARRDMGQRVLANTQRARDLGRQAERVLREQSTLEERSRLQIERGRRVYDELTDALAQEGDAQQRRLLDEASRLLDSAERQFHDQSFEVALRLADSANAILRGLAGDREPGAYGHERLEQELRRTRDLLDRAQQREEAISDSQRQRLHQALRLQDRSEDALRTEHPFMALRLTLQSRGIVRDLLDALGGQVTESDVRQAMDRFDAKLEQLRTAGEPELPQEVGAVIQQALEARGRAQAELARSSYDSALAQLRVGLDLLGRAARRLEELRR